MRHLILLVLMICTAPLALSAAEAPWGTASTEKIDYKPMKVVYDVDAHSMKAFESVLDRASYLTQITGVDPFVSSTVLVLHGPEIEYLATKNTARYRGLVKRIKGLVDSELIELRMCKIAAKSQGYDPEDIQGFVTMVPMGDAEIVRLQYSEGHAYMR